MPCLTTPIEGKSMENEWFMGSDENYMIVREIIDKYKVKSWKRK
jgi:hypothetical protein